LLPLLTKVGCLSIWMVGSPSETIASIGFLKKK
jgi:hypothetical protein